MNLPSHESFLNQSNTQSGATAPPPSRTQPSSFSNNNQHHHHHVVRRRQQQQQLQPLVSLSEERDVLCGRGKAFVDRPANRKFANIIKANLHSYINAKSRKGKTAIVASIVKQLQADGIRFLKPKSDGTSSSFYELNVFESREKTGHALRDLIKQAGKKKKKDKKTKKNPKSNATTTTTTTTAVTTTIKATDNNNDDTSNICNSNNNNNNKHLHHRERTTLLLEPTRFHHHSESLTMESLMEFGVFNLDDDDDDDSSDDDAMLKANSDDNKTDSSRSCESYTPLPASSSTTTNNIAIKLADMLKINDILSSSSSSSFTNERC